MYIWNQCTSSSPASSSAPLLLVSRGQTTIIAQGRYRFQYKRASLHLWKLYIALCKTRYFSYEVFFPIIVS